MAPREQIEMPKASDLQAFDHAVAGHAGTLCDASGALFIKPCVQPEISFYDAVAQDHPELADILPVYMGTLQLTQDDTPEQALERLQQAQTQKPTPAADPVTWVPRGSASITTDRAIVLENAIHGFARPNILDIKLGQRLWADDAPLQKRTRMDEIARTTTHKNLGFRIAGMRVYKGDRGDLESSGTARVRSENDYTVYDKDYGRTEVTDANIVDVLRRFLFSRAAGIDADHGRAIAAAFKADLERVRDVLEKERTRMFSSSLLFVFEGDGAALKAAVAASKPEVVEAAAMKAGEEVSLPVEESEAAESNVDETPANPRKRRRLSPTTPTTPTTSAATADDTLRATSRREVLGRTGDRSSSRTDSGIAMDDEDELRVSSQSQSQTEESFELEDEADDASVSGSDDASDSDSEAELPPIYSLRLIDFAHARFVPPEDGPDENNLLGVRKLIEIFDELAREAEDEAEAETEAEAEAK